MSKINGKKMSKQNQLHDIIDWNIDNLIFADHELGSVPGSNPPISFIRVNLLTVNHKLNDDGTIKLDQNGVPINDTTIGDLIFSFDRLFSFGVSETTSQETKSVTGHSMSFAMWSRDGATEREIQTTRKIESIVQKVKDHLITIKKEIKKPKLEMAELKSLDKILYWKEDENGERVPGAGPTFSPKLIEYKERVDYKTGKIIPHQMSTIFYLENEVDNEGNPIEASPLEFLSTSNEKKYCYVRPAVKFESIFIGAKVISLQCKLTEADVAAVQMGPQRLLHGRHKIQVNNKLTISDTSINPLLSIPVEDDEEKINITAEDELRDDIQDKKPVKKILKKKSFE